MKTFKELMEEKVVTENLDEIKEMAYTEVQIACDNAERIMEMIDDNSEKEGTVVGTTVQYLRVRDDDGILYRVRHKNARLEE